MRDIFIALVVLAMIGVAFYRPWLATLTYLYSDLTQPQRLSYYLIQKFPLNFWLAVTAVTFFMFDKRKQLRFGLIQTLLCVFVLWFTLTTNFAQISDSVAWFKWDSAWKSVLFAGVFIPFVLSTRTRIEAAIGLTILCIGLVTIGGGIKTLLGGGGYDVLALIVRENKGLYESSTISTVGIAVIPLMLYMYRESPLVGRTVWTRLLLGGLILASLLIVVGTEARTGLVCAAALGLMMFRRSPYKLPIAAALVAAGVVALPFLPKTFTDRMATITAPQEDRSAATRTQVWAWALDFVAEHPLGGGFGINRTTRISVQTPVKAPDGEVIGYSTSQMEARAFHSSYFETLAEHGWPGLGLYVAIIGTTVLQLTAIRRRYADAPPDRRWVRALAQALQRAVVIYAVGGLFVGLSTKTTLYVLIGFSVALVHFTAAQRAAAARAAGALRMRRRFQPEPAAA